MFFKVYSYTFQKSEQIFEENKIDQDKCGAEAWGYASAGKFYIEPIPEDRPLWSLKDGLLSSMTVQF